MLSSAFTLNYHECKYYKQYFYKAYGINNNLYYLLL